MVGQAIAPPMALTIDDLFTSPDHYLHSFEGEHAIFMPMDRAAYHRSIFLDQRISPAEDATLPIPVGALLRQRHPALETGWIFHVAHCGSTLLARALDVADQNLVLREPFALRQIAMSGEEDGLGLVLPMLGKRYDPALRTLIKANVPVNFLLPGLAKADRQAPAIFLYLGWWDYLLAILRSDNHRGWLHRITAQLARHLSDTAGLSDGERAAALWLAQVKGFAAAITQMPNARALDAERFFAEPAAMLEKAALLLGVPLTAQDIAERVAGPLFATYSKNPSESFDNATRLARRDALEGALRDELDRADRWLTQHRTEAETAVASLCASAL